MDSPAVTGFVDRLIREGLVDRFNDKEDRRVMKIHLTIKGRDLAESLLPVAREMNKRIEGLVGEKDMKKLLQILDVLEDAL